jgi:hypothetical protein
MPAAVRIEVIGLVKLKNSSWYSFEKKEHRPRVATQHD